MGTGHTPGRRIRAWSCLATAILAAACSRASDFEKFAENDERLEIVTTVPELGETDVSPATLVDFCFSGLLDPRAIDDFDVLLTSGPATFDTQLRLQLMPWLGPGGTSVPSQSEAPWCPGSVLTLEPRAELFFGVVYRARLRPSAVGWNGERLDTTQDGWTHPDEGDPFYDLDFRVAEQDEADPTQDDPTAPTLRELFATGGVFDPGRGVCSCHASRPEDDAIALLDLSTPQRAFEDLVSSSRLRDTGFPMISPRKPSESFFLHKLLRSRKDVALRGVLGEPMPPDAPLAYADYVAIARWIEAGARL